MSKKEVRLLLEKAYKSGQDSVKAMRLIDKGHARWDGKDGRMEKLLDGFLVKKKAQSDIPR